MRRILLTLAALLLTTSVNAEDLIKYCENAIYLNNEPSISKCFNNAEVLSPSQQFEIGNRYASGDYPPISVKNGWETQHNKPDIEKAIYWLRKAALRGNGNAAILLAGRYKYGVDVPKSYLDAINFYEIAAKDGVPKASSDLATMYLEGKGVSKSVFMAYVWDGIALNQRPYPDFHQMVSEEVGNLEKQLSTSEVNKAQQLIQSCLATKLAKCLHAK